MPLFGSRRRLDPDRGYKKTLNIADFFSADVTTAANTYVLLGYYTVGAQQVASLGQGKPNDDPMLQGRVYIDLEGNDDAEKQGFVKMTHESAQGTRTQKIFEERTEELEQSTRSERLALPCATELGFNAVGEDSLIGLYFSADAADDVGNDESTARIPITIWE